ncbi:AraC family transcriptional regulator [Cupriavidus necator]|uniref:AraC family transcriptional regulator n=1 Tax=Cupriavidus necator TaxID=106590 RepID=A0A1U9UVC4_CUPNE|nr:AraC family transcriptional regulator [Cupriavidus necator]AQV96634.1 AraC family transcriptional regulator [Cupriavidus necator]
METQTPMPDGWTQLALPSRWTGMHIDHLIAPSYETEYETAGVIIALVKKSARICESAATGNWVDLGIKSDTVCCLPLHYGDRVRTEGVAEGISLQIDFSWLKNQVDADLSLFSRPIFGLHDKISQLLIEEIYKDNQSSTPNGLVYAESLALSLIHRLNAKSALRPVASKVHHDQRIVNAAIEYIHSNFHEALSLSELAQASGYGGNLFGFLRLIKRHTGKTPHRYIFDVRMEVARNMLTNGTESVTEVALTCGFSNMSHFSTAFKRQWGLTPSDVHRKKKQATGLGSK